MAAPNPFGPTDPGYFSPLDWKELAASFRPSGSNFFSQKGGEASVIGLVGSAKLTAALRYAVGYNNISGGPNIAIRRTNPVAHPKYPLLFCTSAAETEFAPNPAGLKVPANPVAAGGLPQLIASTGYRQSHVTLRFQPLPYTMLEDGSTPSLQEYQRNTFIDQEPRSEVLSLSGFQQIYVEGTGLPAVGYTNPMGTTYQSEVGQVLVKNDLRLTWDLVPENFLMETGTKIPKWPLYCLGGVNNAPFLGYATGTLLFNGMRLTRHPWPLALGTESKFVYTVEFLLTFFDPTKGFTGDPPVRITTNRGHNCLPYRGKVGVGADGNSGLWFLATYDGALGGRRLYGPVGFANLFNCAQNAEIP
jgi:hypothetical protein